MRKLIASAMLAALVLVGCGGGADFYIDDKRHSVVYPTYEYLTYPTISGLEYFNTETGALLSFTTAAGRYTGYTGHNLVTFVLGDIVLFTMPGELARPYRSLYEANDYASSIIYSTTAVENLMAFLMVIDDDGNYRNGIQIAYPVRIAARGMRINFNQSAYNFRSDPNVQFSAAVLSGNTLFGPRELPSVGAVQVAMQVP